MLCRRPSPPPQVTITYEASFRPTEFGPVIGRYRDADIFEFLKISPKYLAVYVGIVPEFPTQSSDIQRALGNGEIIIYPGIIYRITPAP